MQTIRGENMCHVKGEEMSLTVLPCEDTNAASRASTQVFWMLSDIPAEGPTSRVTLGGSHNLFACSYAH